MATIIEIQESKFEHLSDCAEQIVKHGKSRRGGMRDSDYDDEDYPRYY